MKSFSNYLFESKKTYEFKVRIANCDLDSESMDKIETALKQFDLISVSKVKNFPAEDRSIEFPKVGTCEIKDFDIELNYPTTDIAVRMAVAHAVGLKLDSVMAYTKEGFEQRMKDIDQSKEFKKGSSVLSKEKLEDQPKPKLSLDMIKDLESRKYEFATAPEKNGKTTNELPQGNLSPVGSTKNKLSSANRK